MNNDFFEKRLKQIGEKGNLRTLPTISHRNKFIVKQGHTLLNLSSNDYLGLAADLELRREFLSGLTPETFLPSASSSRLLTGNHEIYTAVESKLCELYRSEAALVFSSGYHANCGILPALSTPETLIVSDKLVHASLIDGIRLSGAKSLRYLHNRYGQLEKIVAEHARQYRQIIIVTESIFSMDGDEADLKRLVNLKQRYGNVLLYVDEAHAVGVRGPRGLGCAREKEVSSEIDILVGTFGKAYASAGAFLICTDAVKQYLVNTMRPLIFTTALPPILLQWILFILNKSDLFYDRRERLAITSRILREQLNPLNGKIQSSSHIVPFLAGSSKDAVAMADALQQQGFYILAVRPPTVPEGTARLRISLTADNTLDDVNRLTKALITLKKEIQI